MKEKQTIEDPFLYGCNTLQTKSVWKEVKGYDESMFTNGEDIDYTMKVRSNKNNNFNKTISSKRFPTLIYVGNNTCKIATDNGFKVISFDNSQLEEMEMEEEFGIEIPDEEAEKLATVGDAVKYIDSIS